MLCEESEAITAVAFFHNAIRARHPLEDLNGSPCWKVAGPVLPGGLSILHAAVLHGRVDICCKLLASGSNPWAYSAFGHCPAASVCHGVFGGAIEKETSAKNHTDQLLCAAIILFSRASVESIRPPKCGAPGCVTADATLSFSCEAATLVGFDREPSLEINDCPSLSNQFGGHISDLEPQFGPLCGVRKVGLRLYSETLVVDLLPDAARVQFPLARVVACSTTPSLPNTVEFKLIISADPPHVVSLEDSVSTGARRAATVAGAAPPPPAAAAAAATARPPTVGGAVVREASDSLTIAEELLKRAVCWRCFLSPACASCRCAAIVRYLLSSPDLLSRAWALWCRHTSGGAGSSAASTQGGNAVGSAAVSSDSCASSPARMGNGPPAYPWIAPMYPSVAASVWTRFPEESLDVKVIAPQPPALFFSPQSAEDQRKDTRNVPSSSSGEEFFFGSLPSVQSSSAEFSAYRAFTFTVTTAVAESCQSALLRVLSKSPPHPAGSAVAVAPLANPASTVFASGSSAQSCTNVISSDQVSPPTPVHSNSPATRSQCSPLRRGSPVAAMPLESMPRSASALLSQRQCVSSSRGSSIVNTSTFKSPVWGSPPDHSLSEDAFDKAYSLRTDAADSILPEEPEPVAESGTDATGIRKEDVDSLDPTLLQFRLFANQSTADYYGRVQRNDFRKIRLVGSGSLSRVYAAVYTGTAKSDAEDASPCNVRDHGLHTLMVVPHSRAEGALPGELVALKILYKDTLLRQCAGIVYSVQGQREYEMSLPVVPPATYVPAATVLEDGYVTMASKPLLEETAILQGIEHHPHIVRLRQAFQEGEKIYMVLDLLPGGDIAHHLKAAGSFMPCLARQYALEVAYALDHLHRRNIVYRDLKASNVLLDLFGHAVLTDFSIARFLPPRKLALAETFCGTPHVMAPELVARHPYSTAVDWWALGCFLYHMTIGVMPFSEEAERLNAAPNPVAATQETALDAAEGSSCYTVTERDGARRKGSALLSARNPASSVQGGTPTTVASKAHCVLETYMGRGADEFHNDFHQQVSPTEAVGDNYHNVPGFGSAEDVDSLTQSSLRSVSTVSRASQDLPADDGFGEDDFEETLCQCASMHPGPAPAPIPSPVSIIQTPKVSRVAPSSGNISESGAAGIAPIVQAGVPTFTESDMPIFRHAAFGSETVVDVYNRILQDVLVIPDWVPAELADLLRQLLRKDPKQRLCGLGAVTQHPFFAPLMKLRPAGCSDTDVSWLRSVPPAMTPTVHKSFSEFMLQLKRKIVLKGYSLHQEDEARLDANQVSRTAQ